MTETPRPVPWDSHGNQVSGTSIKPSYHHSDLGLHFDLLTEGHAYSCLGGRLHASLDPAKAWDRENPSLLYLSSGKTDQALEQPCASLRFHFMLLSKCPHKSTLCHDFAARLHRLHRLHGLHWSHGGNLK